MLTHHDQQVNERLEMLADAIEASTAHSDHRSDHTAQLLAETENRLDAVVRQLSVRVDDTRSQVDRLDIEQAAAPYTSRPDVLRHRGPDGTEYLGSGRGHPWHLCRVRGRVPRQ